MYICYFFLVIHEGGSSGEAFQHKLNLLNNFYENMQDIT